MSRRGWISDPWAVTLTTAMVARLTRLVTEDQLPPVEAARTWVEDHAPADWAHGIRCPHCVSFWAAFAATAAATVADRAGHRRTWLLACAPWAISAAVGWAADHEVA